MLYIYQYIPLDWKPLSLPLKAATITFTDELVVNGQSTKETKRPLSHLSPTLRERGRERRKGAVKPTIAECIWTVVVSYPLRPKHIAESGQTERKKERKKRQIWAKRYCNSGGSVESRPLCKHRCEALRRAKTASGEFIWIEVKGQAAINHGQSWGLNSSVSRARWESWSRCLKGLCCVCLILHSEGPKQSSQSTNRTSNRRSSSRHGPFWWTFTQPIKSLDTVVPTWHHLTDSCFDRWREIIGRWFSPNTRTSAHLHRSTFPFAHIRAPWIGAQSYFIFFSFFFFYSAQLPLIFDVPCIALIMYLASAQTWRTPSSS